jgi:hypothetical protein
MARGRGGRDLIGGRGKQVRDYYDGIPSDSGYKRTAHQRAVRQSRKAWRIRLLVVALLAGAVYLFGDDVMRMVRRQSQQTGTELRRVGDNIKAGRDRRSGADLTEGE